MAQPHPARAGSPRATPGSTTAEPLTLRLPEGWSADAWRDAGMRSLEATRLADVDDAAAAIGSIVSILEGEEAERAQAHATGHSARWRLTAGDRAALLAGARLLTHQLAGELERVREVMTRDRRERGDA